MTSIKNRLKELKLVACAESIDIRNEEALRNNLSYCQFLDKLLEDELAFRNARAYDRRMKDSELEPSKTIENYDFSFQPGLQETEIADLASCNFISEKKNIIMIGKPGTGKTHLANAMGVKAINRGFSVMFIHANRLIEKLVVDKGEPSYYKMKRRLSKVDLLILDEFGFKALPPEGIADFYDIVNNRNEKGSIIITSNRGFKQWGDVFGDLVICGATIDRLLHKAALIKIEGESYRIKDFQRHKSTSSTGN